MSTIGPWTVLELPWLVTNTKTGQFNRVATLELGQQYARDHGWTDYTVEKVT